MKTGKRVTATNKRRCYTSCTAFVAWHSPWRKTKMRVHRVYLSNAFVDVEVELPAHIEADSVAVARLIIDVNERDFDRIWSLRIKRHPVGAAIFGVCEEFVRAFSGGELCFNFVHLLPSSLRRHLCNLHSSFPRPGSYALRMRNTVKPTQHCGLLLILFPCTSRYGI